MNGRRLSSRYCERIDLIPLIDRERQAMCPGLFNPDPLDPVPALSDRSAILDQRPSRPNQTLTFWESATPAPRSRSCALPPSPSA
jgi:hypothetical protein